MLDGKIVPAQCESSQQVAGVESIEMGKPGGRQVRSCLYSSFQSPNPPLLHPLRALCPLPLQSHPFHPFHKLPVLVSNHPFYPLHYSLFQYSWCSSSSCPTFTCHKPLKDSRDIQSTT